VGVGPSTGSGADCSNEEAGPSGARRAALLQEGLPGRGRLLLAQRYGCPRGILAILSSKERQVNIMHDLVELNYRFGQAEKEATNGKTKEQGHAFFTRYLHEKLVFRRAGGGVVNKAEFLRDLSLANNRTDQLRSYVMEVTESEDGKTAEVLVLV